MDPLQPKWPLKWRCNIGGIRRSRASRESGVESVSRESEAMTMTREKKYWLLTTAIMEIRLVP